jgi:hypothetical protein
VSPMLHRLAPGVVLPSLCFLALISVAGAHLGPVLESPVQRLKFSLF